MEKRKNEKNTKILCSLGITAGLIFQFAGIATGTENLRMLSGICIGMGAMCFSFSINRLYRLSQEKEFPEIVHQEEIELRDERSTQIRSRAKAKTSDFTRWVIIGLAYLNLLVQGTLWMTLSLIGVFVLIYLMDWCYMDKYQREM